MSSAMRDLWPDDIKSEDVISPEEILKHQARRLEERTGALLVGHVVRREGDDRVVIGFEAEAPRADSRVRLFEVHHRLQFEYPASILPPDEDLPDFLRDRVYRPTMSEAMTAVGRIGSSVLGAGSGEWVENEWVASSPREFSEKVENVLRRPAVKGIVLSLLSRANQEGPASGEEEDES